MSRKLNWSSCGNVAQMCGMPQVECDREAVAESPEDSDAVPALAASNAAATAVSQATASVFPTDSKATAAMMEAHEQRPPLALSIPDSQNHHGKCATSKHHQGKFAKAQSAARQKGVGEGDDKGAILGLGGSGRGDAASSRAGKRGAPDDDFDRRLEGYSATVFVQALAHVCDAQ